VPIPGILASVPPTFPVRACAADSIAHQSTSNDVLALRVCFDAECDTEARATLLPMCHHFHENRSHRGLSARGIAVWVSEN
jgi:hypothetical protein